MAMTASGSFIWLCMTEMVQTDLLSASTTPFRSRILPLAAFIFFLSAADLLPASHNIFPQKHKIDQTPAQNHRHQNNRKEYDTYFSAVIGFIPLHEKHHDPFLKAYALQSLSKNSLSLVLLFLFISGLGSVMLSGIL